MPSSPVTTWWTEAKALAFRSHLLWYGLTAALVSGAPILLLPFLLSRLPAEQYANIVSMQIIVMFGGLLINLGVDGSVARDAFRARPRHLASQVTVALSTQIGGFIVLSGLALAMVGQLEGWIAYPREWIGITILGCLLQQVTLFTANLLRLLGRVRYYAALSILLATLEIGLSLILLYTVIPSWEARLWGFLTASSVSAGSATLLLWHMKLIQPPRHSRRVVRRMLRFGLPTLPHTLCSLLSAWADRFFVLRLCGAATAGVYAAAAQSVMIVSFVGSLANLAWTPWLFRQLSSRGTLHDVRSRIAARAYTLAGALVLSGVLVLGALAGYFLWLAPPSYASALSLLPWLVLGATANSVYKVSSNFLLFYGRTGYMAGVAFLILAISLAAQIVFVPRFGATASAVVFAAINVIQLTCTALLAARLLSNRGHTNAWIHPRSAP